MFVSHSIVLASNSPRRQELLSLTGWIFSSSPANIDETPRADEQPEAYVTRLAWEKALACSAETGNLILAADTIVVDDTELMGKPVDSTDARRMLTRLRGHAHRVLTAIALYDRAAEKMEMELCVTAVPMRNYTDDETERYIESGDPLDKAGAYAIQHQGFHPVEKFSGCFASVMGLPLCHLKRMSTRMGVDVSQELVLSCEKFNQYICPIHQQVEEGANIG